MARTHLAPIRLRSKGTRSDSAPDAHEVLRNSARPPSCGPPQTRPGSLTNFLVLHDPGSPITGTGFPWDYRPVLHPPVPLPAAIGRVLSISISKCTVILGYHSQPTTTSRTQFWTKWCGVRLDPSTLRLGSMHARPPPNTPFFSSGGYVGLVTRGRTGSHPGSAAIGTASGREGITGLPSDRSPSTLGAWLSGGGRMPWESPPPPTYQCLVFAFLRIHPRSLPPIMTCIGKDNQLTRPGHHPEGCPHPRFPCHQRTLL